MSRGKAAEASLLLEHVRKTAGGRRAVRSYARVLVR
jgi:hypothetical protein